MRRTVWAPHSVAIIIKANRIRAEAVRKSGFHNHLIYSYAKKPKKLGFKSLECCLQCERIETNLFIQFNI